MDDKININNSNIYQLGDRVVLLSKKSVSILGIRQLDPSKIEYLVELFHNAVWIDSSCFERIKKLGSNNEIL